MAGTLRVNIGPAPGDLDSALGFDLEVLKDAVHRELKHLYEFAELVQMMQAMVSVPRAAALSTGQQFVYLRGDTAVDALIAFEVQVTLPNESREQAQHLRFADGVIVE